LPALANGEPPLYPDRLSPKGRNMLYLHEYAGEHKKLRPIKTLVHQYSIRLRGYTT
jgi:hypothetical protein